MTRFLRRLIAVFLFASAATHAAAMSPDPTGYWYNPAESGWGVSIAQQGDVLFATLLVYDEQRRPEWLVASNVRDSGGGVFSGTLYRTSGPWFGSAFDPATVGSEAVGTLSLQNAVNSPVGQASLRLSYTVNGVAVTKGVVRLTWDSDAARLTGAYFGGMSVALSFPPQSAGCASTPTFFSPGTAFRINLAAPDTIAMIAGEGIDVVTVIGGPYKQSGQFGTIAGFVFRGNIVNPILIADAQLTNLAVADDGFSGHIRITMENCIYEGAIGGFRRSL